MDVSSAASSRPALRTADQLRAGSKMRPLQTPRMSVTTQSRHATMDIRRRMDDIYDEMEQSASLGRIRMPPKFVDFHRSDVMYRFTRAAVAYALSFVKVMTLRKDGTADWSSGDGFGKLFHAPLAKELTLTTTSSLPNASHQSHSQSQPSGSAPATDEWRLRAGAAATQQAACVTELGETYARLVLHCSNFEHHKEDEHFFECIYFFVCSVIKVGLAPEHWNAIEEELGFLFRGAQFSANVKLHTSAKTQREAATAAALSAAAASDAAAHSAAKKIQSLSATGSALTDVVTRGDVTPFLLPRSRFCHFSESVPVGKIVSELDAAKLRATRNIELSQSVRARIIAQRGAERRRQLEALTSPRVGVRLDALELERGSRGSGFSPVSSSSPCPPRRCKGAAATLSPRLSMRSTFTSRSPAVNHLLPGTEDRVRLVLENYEREFQRKLSEQRVAGAGPWQDKYASDLSDATVLDSESETRRLTFAAGTQRQPKQQERTHGVNRLS